MSVSKPPSPARQVPPVTKWSKAAVAVAGNVSFVTTSGVASIERKPPGHNSTPVPLGQQGACGFETLTAFAPQPPPEGKGQ